MYSCVHLRYVNIDIWKSENNGSIEKQQQNHCGCILDCKSVSVPELPTVLNLSLPFLSTEFDFSFFPHSLISGSVIVEQPVYA